LPRRTDRDAGSACTDGEKAIRELNAWVEVRAPIPSGSVARRLVQEGEWSAEDSCISQDVSFRDWPKGYDLTELAKHYSAFEETFSLLWFEQDRGRTNR
jgi:hypothetical protein